MDSPEDGRFPARSPRPRRLRAAGLFTIVLGAVTALVTYWLETRDAGPSIEDLIPGTADANARQMAILYGPWMATFMGWIDALETPAGHAVLIGGGAVLIAALCFHVARLPDEATGPPHEPTSAP